MMRNMAKTIASAVAAVCLLSSTLTEIHGQRDELQVEVVEEQDADTALMKTKKIRESLGTRVNLRFKAATLEQIAEALRDEFKIPIRVDEVAVRSFGIELTREYKVKFENVALSEGLLSFMSTTGLGFTITESQLVFTSAQHAQGMKSTHLYDVSDLARDPELQRVTVIAASDQGSSPVLSDIEATIQKHLSMNPWNSGFSVRILEKTGASYVEVSCNEMQHETVRVYLQQLRSTLKERADSVVSDDQQEDVESDKNETRVYLISIQNGVEAKEYGELVHAVFAEHFDANKGQNLKAIAGTLVITNNHSLHKRIQLFLKDMQLLPPNPGDTLNQPAYSFPGGGGMGGFMFPGGGMGPGGGAIAFPPAIHEAEPAD